MSDVKRMMILGTTGSVGEQAVDVARANGARVTGISANSNVKRTEEIAAHALFSPAHPQSLRPKDASVWVDRTYILAAMGLLSSYYPETALRIMKKELEHNGYSE